MPTIKKAICYNGTTPKGIKRMAKKMADKAGPIGHLKQRRTRALQRAERLRTEALRADELADDLALQIAFAEAAEVAALAVVSGVGQAVRIATDYRRGGAA